MQPTDRSDGDRIIAVAAYESGPVSPSLSGVSFINGNVGSHANWAVFTDAHSPMHHCQLGEIAFDGNGDLWITTISEGVAIARVRGTGICLDDCDRPGMIASADLVSMLSAFSVETGTPETDANECLIIADIITAKVAFSPCD